MTDHHARRIHRREKVRRPRTGVTLTTRPVMRAVVSMKWVGIALALLVLSAALLAQAAPGGIAGRVTTDQNDPAAGVTIQAKDMTGKISSVVADKNGEFRLTNLPAGTYEISVPQMGLRTARYEQPNVVI